MIVTADVNFTVENYEVPIYRNNTKPGRDTIEKMGSVY